MPRDEGAERHGTGKGPGVANEVEQAPGTPEVGLLQGVAATAIFWLGCTGPDGQRYRHWYRGWYTLFSPQKRLRLVVVAGEEDRLKQQSCRNDILVSGKSPQSLRLAFRKWRGEAHLVASESVPP